MDEEQDHHLFTYLNEILPTLGLDPETYSSYVIGCINNLEDDNDEHEDLDEIIELLRASSETHSDDETVWGDLRSEVLKRHEESQKEIKKKKDMELLEKQEIEEIKKREDIEVALEAQREMERRKLEQSQGEIDPAKKALLAQYEYDDSEEFDNNGNLVDPTKSKNTSKGSKNASKEAEEPVMNNREIAEKIKKEKTQQLKSSNTGSKKEEQVKTKNAKLDKIKQKEARRNRATKGERKR